MNEQVKRALIPIAYLFAWSASILLAGVVWA